MISFMPDAAMARVWYEKATELGSLAAPRRLEMLTKETGTREKQRLQPLAIGDCADVNQRFPFIAALITFFQMDFASAQVIPKSI